MRNHNEFYRKCYMTYSHVLDTLAFPELAISDVTNFQDCLKVV
jgi:hypothetical protein